MARKHHPQVHYGSPNRGTVCGLPYPRVGAGLTLSRASVTCQSCRAVLEATSAPEKQDPHASREYRVAVREYRRAVGDGCVCPTRRLRHLEGSPPVPLRLH
jgi:hypothetical protein